ncbi:PfkB family carbohydrate kinase [Streptomyces sp. NPDC000594]|uniref:carbohydrate kinase family protein n=1 Tax=Streptomyces sp. NPDC000594 TaxID=3154261 RepID=UPI00332A21B2
MLVIGDVVDDVIVRHGAPPRQGTDTAARIRILPGGAGANAACWAAHRGLADVRLLGRVGRADLARHEERLRAAGVRPLLIPDDTAPTGTVVVLVGPDAERTFLTDSGAVTLVSPDDWSPDLLSGTGGLHLSGYLFFSGTAPALARLAMDTARSLGVPVSVDPASTGFLRTLGPDRALTCYDGVDILLPNADEARCLTGRADPAEAAAALSRRVALVVVTLGAAGALVAENGVVTARVPAPRVRPRDSTGAGDAFTGAFLAARLAGADAPAAAEEGCRAGAEAVTLIGGRPGHADLSPAGAHSTAQDGASASSASRLPWGST